MNILIFGSNGQLGSELSKKLDAISISRKNNKKFNYLNLIELKKILKFYSPNIIINCVAYTDVNKAEIDRKKCYNINTKAVIELTKYCKKNNIILIHFSTDFVFDGRAKKPYLELSKTNPLNYYGKTKLLADKFIIKSKCKYIILRVSWLYNLNFNNNFINKIKTKLKKRENICVPINQIGSPTSAKFIVKYLINIIKLIKLNKFKFGLYNLSTSKPKSRYHTAKFIAEQLKYNSKKIKPYEYNNDNEKVKRPYNSMLDNTKISQALNIKLSTWKQDLRRNLINE